MMGSGTTLLTARLLGHEAVGVDTDPMAVLIAGTSTRDLDAQRLRREASALLLAASKVAPRLSISDCYPAQADDETRQFIRYWFDSQARRQLSALCRQLDEGPYRDKKFLMVAISRMIIAKQGGVSLALDVSHSRPHRRTDGVVPRRPFDIFQRHIDAIARSSSFSRRSGLPKTRALLGDCRSLPFEDETFDCILTSPPYLNAIDYLRGHKLSLVWFGHSIKDLRQVRSDSIGSECGTISSELDGIVRAMSANHSDVSTRLHNMMRTYAIDLSRALSEMRRVSRRGAQLTIVIGDCTVRGVEIRNSIAVDRIAQASGFERLTRSTRKLPPNRRYLPPPSNRGARKELQRRMRDEVVLRYRAS